ncbi:sugar ABC transporter substrate-binding protein [Bacillus sp. C11]|nr:sugar ABC transporter substrate-binding protein [Neobacillus terrae]
MLVLLAGCSTAKTQGTDGKVVLKLLMEQVPDSDIVKKMTKDFNKENPNIKIDIEMLSYDQIRDKLVSSFLAPKSSYDIIVVDNPWMYDFASAGYLEPLDKRIKNAKNYDFEDFSAPLRKIATVKGKVYGIPFYNYATGVIYRKDEFEQNNIAVPKTLDELQAAAKKLTKDNHYGIASQPQKGYKILEEWSNWLFAAGGEIQDNQGNIKLDSPEAREALSKYIETYKSSAPPNSSNWAFDEAMRSVSSGQSAMTLNYNWMLPTLNNKTGPAGDLAGKFDLAEVPGGKAALGAWYWSIPAKTTHKDEVWKFINWITSSKQEVNRVILGGAPVRNSAMDNPKVWEKGYGESYYKTLKNILEDAEPLAEGPNAEETIQVIGTELNAAVNGQKSVDQAIKDAAAKAKETLKK